MRIAARIHLAIAICCTYEGMIIALPAEIWDPYRKCSPNLIFQKLLELGRKVIPRTVSTSKRGPKKQKIHTVGTDFLVHHSTARLLKLENSLLR